MVESNNMISSFSQIPLPRLLYRVDIAEQGSNEFLSFLQSRYELEEKNVLFSVKMSRMNIYEQEIPYSKSEKALGFLKNFFLFNSREHVSYHKTFGEDILRRVEETKAARALEIIKYKNIVQNSIKQVYFASDLLDKAKINYSKLKLDLTSYKEKLLLANQAVVEYERINEEKKKDKDLNKTNKSTMSKMFSRFESSPEEDRDKLLVKVAKKDEKVRNALELIESKKQLLAIALNSRDYSIQEVIIFIYYYY
jgi:hypothetical protein